MPLLLSVLVYTAYAAQCDIQSGCCAFNDRSASVVAVAVVGSDLPEQPFLAVFAASGKLSACWWLHLTRSLGCTKIWNHLRYLYPTGVPHSARDDTTSFGAVSLFPRGLSSLLYPHSLLSLDDALFILIIDESL